MVCLACHTAGSRLCADCARTLRPAPERLLPGGIRVVAAFEHVGAARVLVHHLKYRGVEAYADVVTDRLAGRLPVFPLVPIPRALSRRIKYGVDPARVFAKALSRRLGVPVVDALAAPLHAPRRAGGDHTGAVRPPRARMRLRFPVVVVDDVVTTGATALAAVAALGADEARLVAAANVVCEVSNVTPV